MDDIPDLSFIADNAGIDTYEVLKGPQALLYGANPSIFGLVIKTTKKPQPEFGANFTLSVGDYGWTRFDGDITGHGPSAGNVNETRQKPYREQIT